MDADLIMLALGSGLSNFYILREDQMSRDYAFFVINVGAFAKDLTDIMKWTSSEFTFNYRSAIHDFIFMCFAVGNDFLPHIPAIEIIQDGIDFMLEVYRKTGEKYGHLTKFVKGCPRFSRRPVAAFLFGMSTYEKKVLENKMNNKADFLPNLLLEKYATLKEDEKTYDVNLTEYRKAYYKEKFCTNSSENPLSKICHDYLRGMQWVLTYYIQGPPDWKWQYEHHYAPFAYTLAQNIGTFTFTEYSNDTKPTLPFIQLLSVLPPKSAELLPEPLCDLLSGEEMAPLCPKEFKIDMDGCREEWEGTVILPIIDYATIEKLYMKYRKEIDKTEYKRNVMGKTFVYKHCAQQTLLKSFYGNFVNKSTVESVEV
jgi:5'-3' exonuclease